MMSTDRTDRHERLHSLTITTRTPAAWLAVDLVSGDLWRANPDAASDGGLQRADWRRATPTQVARLASLLGRNADEAVVVDALAALLDDPLDTDVRARARLVLDTARRAR